MILLDTDHLTVLRYKSHSLYAGLVSRLSAAQDREFAVTVISLEEQMRGWLAEINRKRRAEDLVSVYAELTKLVSFYDDWQVAAFDDRAVVTFNQLKVQKINIGTLDLRIASIALANDALLLSANLVHFQKVPGLRVEDWLYA